MEEKKKPYMSKTLWANAIVAILAFFPEVSAKFDASQVAMTLGVMNMMLRLITKEKIGLNE